jgi:hypothetical protein
MNYEKQYGRHCSYLVRSPRTGRVVRYFHADEARNAEIDADLGLRLPPPDDRLLPLGEGITGERGKYRVTFRDKELPTERFLVATLRSWCQAEEDEYEGRKHLWWISLHGHREAGDPLPDTRGLLDKDGYKLRPLPLLYGVPL